MNAEHVPYAIEHDGRAVTQLGLPTVGSDTQRYRAAPRVKLTVRPEPMLETYSRRLAARGAARNGEQAYRYQLDALLRAAEHIAGRRMSLEELFLDVAVLGAALIHDRSSDDARQLSRWTLAQRRSATRSFVMLMRRELQQLTGTDPHVLLDEALRSVAQRIGTGYRLTGGSPRRRGGHAPTMTDIHAVVTVGCDQQGFAGIRNRSFFSILAATGARVNALRELDGQDCVLLPSGRLRLFLHEKGKAAPREVELSIALTDALHVYVDAYNDCAATFGWRHRVRLGESGPVWMSDTGRRWSYQQIATELREACNRAAVEEITPHALRRGFATTAASSLPRHTVALAGGWHGLERLDNHYVQARNADIWTKIAGATHRPVAVDQDVVTDAPVALV